MNGYTDSGSLIDIGTPVTSRMKGGSIKGAVAFKMNNDFFWSSFLQGVGIGYKP